MTTATKPMLTPAMLAAIDDAERRIRAILRELENATGLYIEGVAVDASNHAGLRTAIYLTKVRRI